MGMSIFGIGVSGMNAAQAGLVTTGHNIANASSAGFSRQETIQTSALPQLTGAGFIGQGVDVTTVKRLYSEALNNQLALAQSQGSEIDAYAGLVGQLANLLADPGSGLSPRLHDFFGALAGVASDPESTASRQALLSAANTLGASFRGLDQYFAQMQAGVNAEITDSVALVNNYARQIAALNQSIVVAESAGPRQSANDLHDQRDQLVASLNQQVRASVLVEGDGSYSVFVGNGQALVVGKDVFQLEAKPSLYDPQRLEVGYNSGAASVLLSQSSLQGGRLGGLLAFRSESLDPAQNALGRVAMGLAQSFNQQHALGQDLNGALGGAFFSMAGPQVLASANNSGTASVSATLVDSDALSTSDYRLHYNGALAGVESFTLTRLSDGNATAINFPGATGYPYSLDVDGVALTLTGGAALNDRWLIQPTRQGASGIQVALSDPARIAVAAPVRSAADIGNRGSGAISAASVSSIANLPLAGTVTLSFDATLGQFTVSGAMPGVAPLAYTDGATISFNGIQFRISGAPLDGDSFTIGRNINGVSDNRNALALGALQSASTLGRDASVPASLANTSYQGAYSQLVSQIGNSARQMDVAGQAQKNVIAQTRQSQQAVSGVNLDEEAANLLRYQQAYQASGKMIQIAAMLFDTVLGIGR